MDLHPASDRKGQRSGSAERSLVRALRGGSAALGADPEAPEAVASSAVGPAGGTVGDTVPDRPSDRSDLDRQACPLGRHIPALIHQINLGRTELFHKKTERRERVSLPS